LTTERKPAANSTYAKVAVQWLNQALCRFGGPILSKFVLG